MSAYLSMIRIEFRRSPGVWLLLPIICLAWYIAVFRTTEDLAPGLVLWPEISLGIRNSVVFLGPMLSALGAWVAGREARRGIGELLETTSRSAPARDLALFSGTTLWGAVGYLLAAMAIIAFGYWQTTWGSPYLLQVLVGLLGVGAAGAMGYAIGSFVHSRFTPPLVAVALFLAQQFISFANSSVRYLSPLDWSSADVFYGMPHNLGVAQAAWLAGLAAVALALVAFKSRRTPLTIGALGIALVLAFGGAVPLLSTSPQTVLSQRDGREHIPYELVCVERAMPVCVHPAYQALLPTAGELVQNLSSPLQGIPGGPARAEQRPSSGLERTFTDGTLVFVIDRDNEHLDSLAQDIARSLVVDESVVHHASLGWSGTTEVQAVVGSWLLMQAGFPQMRQEPRGDIVRQYQVWLALGQDVVEHVEAFAEVEPEAQHAWLEENYEALRAGELALEDLP